MKRKSKRKSRKRKSRKYSDGSRKSDFIIYTKEGCPACINAKKTLTDKGTKFKQLDYTEVSKEHKNLIATTPYQHLLENGEYNYVPKIFKKVKDGYEFIGGNDQLSKHI